MNRLLFWAEKSNQDTRAEPIFAWLCENYVREIRRENSHLTYPELKRGKIYQQMPDYKQEKNKKVGLLKKLKIIIP